MEIQEIIKVQKKDIKVFENSKLASKEKRMLKNKLNGKIRVVFLEDVAYFVVVDIAKLLGMGTRTDGLLYKIAPENKKLVFSELLGRSITKGVWCVNSKALTQIFDKPSVVYRHGTEKVIQWLTNEVIPSVNIAVNENIAYKQNNKRDFALLQEAGGKAIIIADVDEVDEYLLDDYKLVGYVTNCKLDKLELKKGFAVAEKEEIKRLHTKWNEAVETLKEWLD